MSTDIEAVIIFYHSIGLLLAMSLGAQIRLDGVKEIVTAATSVNSI